MSDVLREVVLIAATMTMGLMAGVFGIYSNAIMPGLGRTDDRTFVAAFQSIDRAIINPAFMATFVGALALTALAALLHLKRSILPWTAAAFVLYLLVFVITIRVMMGGFGCEVLDWSVQVGLKVGSGGRGDPHIQLKDQSGLLV
jgi:uncharacterized membrane protein